ncbi:MAG: hypothetical protein D6732_28200 [Methanobacteriota archaeon]|nr:MAG: hypothetical protein D6732_28200 [Euryarchaeota archaeon]
MEEDIRQLKLRILATFFTPPQTFFAPSGRIISLPEFSVRNGRDVHILDLEQPSQELIHILDEIEFLRPVLKNLDRTIRNWAYQTTDTTIKNLIEKLTKNNQPSKFVEMLIQWLQRFR